MILSCIAKHLHRLVKWELLSEKEAIVTDGENRFLDWIAHLRQQIKRKLGEWQKW